MSSRASLSGLWAVLVASCIILGSGCSGGSSTPTGDGGALGSGWRCADGTKCDCERDRKVPTATNTLPMCQAYPCCFTFQPGPANPGTASAPNERECSCRAIPDDAQCTSTIATLAAGSGNFLINYARTPKCPPDTSTTVDGGVADAGSACIKRWNHYNTSAATHSITVEQGAMVLRATGLGGEPVNTDQNGLSDDFDISFTFEGFTAGGTGAFAEAYLGSPLGANQNARIGTSPMVGISAQLAGGSPDFKATTATAGTMRFQRTGATLVVTTTAGGQTATVTNPAFTTAPVIYGVAIGSNSGVVAGATEVHFTDFTVTKASPGVVSDTFDCDSLR